MEDKPWERFGEYPFTVAFAKGGQALKVDRTSRTGLLSVQATSSHSLAVALVRMGDGPVRVAKLIHTIGDVLAESIVNGSEDICADILADRTTGAVASDENPLHMLHAKLKEADGKRKPADQKKAAVGILDVLAAMRSSGDNVEKPTKRLKTG